MNDVGGMKEVVNEKIGMLVPPRNGRALKEAIDKMFAMDYEAMGKNAHEYAEKECSWEANTQKIKTRKSHWFLSFSKSKISSL